MREVDLGTFARAHADGAVVIDVREADEYLSAHVPGARLVPMGQLPARLHEIEKNSPVFVICASGGRSAAMASFLETAGYDACSVADGTGGWVSSGRPVVQGSGERG